MELVICIGSSCHLKGSRQVVERLRQLIEEANLMDKVALSGTFCMGNCQKGISVTLDGKLFSLSPENVDGFFEDEVLARG
jgi:NADH:ubiquinone oxidoreductase subunit E